MKHVPIPPEKLAFVAAMLLQEAIDRMSENKVAYVRNLKYTAKAFQDQAKKYIERQYIPLNPKSEAGLNTLWTVTEDLAAFLLSATVQDIYATRKILDAVKSLKDGQLSELLALLAAFQAGDVRIEK